MANPLNKIKKDTHHKQPPLKQWRLKMNIEKGNKTRDIPGFKPF